VFDEVSNLVFVGACLVFESLDPTSKTWVGPYYSITTAPLKPTEVREAEIIELVYRTDHLSSHSLRLRGGFVF
jgi:hypothetical protein